MRICKSSFVCACISSVVFAYVCRVLCVHMFVEFCVRICISSFVCACVVKFCVHICMSSFVCAYVVEFCMCICKSSFVHAYVSRVLCAYVFLSLCVHM